MKSKHLKIDLKKRRKDLGMTQAELAKKLHVAVATVQKWEKRQSNIGSNYLLPYAKSIHLDPMEIIDPNGEFDHVGDEHRIDSVDSINNIKSICMDLESKQVNHVFNFAKVQLADQKNVRITHEDLKAKYGDYDLKIQMLVHDDSTVELLNENTEFFQEFSGKIPQTYSQCMQFKTSSVMGFGFDQIVFLRKAHIELMYSGIPVIAKKKAKGGKEIAKIFKFRYIHKTTYLIPLTSDASQKDESELGEKENKYIWHDSDGWEVTDLINQPAF
ncbi:helix-turn-helix domain-containing protein [Apilactobacillus timberlakei]|uniref:XRE family transcriptional regulator n=1 Tax=Apilactobacillus timberlakei TaxID=2008380 RepID=A0ABY2YRC5_9LACO|nr:helix-turn-helix transcriptional regulator [Apilactobacillus timberlakei]TPR12415.1 XRE family transcriptional regulator [Apilactobacillus timberlakei]TPR12955.1 XRE family transcriptional regulator [Apilactobacillus timberlakei]